MNRKVFFAEVSENISIAPKIMKMTLRSEEISENARPGQFVNFYPDADRLILPRPFGIHSCSKSSQVFSVIYEIVGEGTEEFAGKKAGDMLRTAGPFGNGFDFSFLEEDGRNKKRVLLAGGGVGTSVLLFAAERLAEMNVDTIAVLGFREWLFGIREFEKLGCSVYVTTDSGAEGTFRGNVCECMEENGLTADHYMACGPERMLKAVTEYAEKNGSAENLQVSMDGRMGCGYGVCLGCGISIKRKGDIQRKRVCADGPVFFGNEVMW